MALRTRMALSIKRAACCIIVLALIAAPVLSQNLPADAQTRMGIGLVNPMILQKRYNEECALVCHEDSCGTPALRYGRFCGGTNKGCPGLEPCDDLDQCCAKHNDCVAAELGVSTSKCEGELLQCVLDVKASGKEGFSQKCPYEVVLHTVKVGAETLYNAYSRMDL